MIAMQNQNQWPFSSLICTHTAYLALPLRPPAEGWVQPPSEERLMAVYHIFQKHIPRVEILMDLPETDLPVSNEPVQALLNTLQAHPLGKKEVEKYIKFASSKSELERTDLAKDKTGVFTGAYAINPVNNEKIPIWIADYVMMGYGTGAIMAVPAHDERDYEFAKKYNLPIKEVVQDKCSKDHAEHSCFSGEGIAVNSEWLNFLETKEAKEKMIAYLEKHKIGKKAINYKIKDWVFSRQRYWGEPIPLIHCEKCGVVGVPEKDLPVKLPEVEHYEPSGTGESPLATIPEWVNTKCPQCGGSAKRETNTMPQWAGSSWYYLRYIDPHNDKALIDKNKDKYWSPVDFYVGGAEHATRHLVYARFWHKFLYDIGVVANDEPFKRLQHVGLIMAEDGRKMSKRWGNVINPDDIVESHGADAMRVYEMFMGPFSQSCAWSTNGLVGARKFLEKIWKLAIARPELTEGEGSHPFLFSKAKGAGESGVRPLDKKSNITSLLHKTIKKVGEDIESFKLNTAISTMMILVNALEKEEKINEEEYEKLLIILSPFAPHITEELWESLGHKESIFKEKWPEFNPELIKDETINLIIQVNGKLRDTLEVPSDISEDEAREKALNSEKIKKWTENKEIKKVIFVKGKLINIVII